MTTRGMLAGALVMGGAFAGPLHAAEPVSFASNVVELPPFIVTEASTPWRYVAGTKIEVLSRCSDHVTQLFWQRHERLMELWQLVLPPSLEFEKDTPDLILLVNDQTASSLSRQIVAGPDAFPDGPAEAGSAESRQRMDSESIRFLPNVALDDVDDRAVFGLVEERGFNADTLIFSEARTQFVLRRRLPPLPFWFTEGFQRLSVDMRFGGDAVEIAPLTWLDGMNTSGVRADVDFPRTFIPLADLLESPPPLHDREAYRLWRDEAALLIRWALDGKNAPRRAAFWRYVAWVSREPPSEGMFRDCLGFGYSDALDQLSDYLIPAIKGTITLRPDKLSSLPAPRIRDATEAEVARMKGEWERLEVRLVRTSHPDYASRYIAQARRTLGDAYAHGIRDGQVLASLGLLECDLGNDAGAASYLTAAAEAHVVRPRVYVELARINYLTELAHPAAGTSLDANQLNSALIPLAAAHAQHPPLLAMYALMSEAWARNNATLRPAQFALLDEGLKLFPREAALIYYVAALRAAHGFKAEALVLADRGLTLGLSATGRTKFLNLKAALGAAPAPKP
jgi:hypothetical protein